MWNAFNECRQLVAVFCSVCVRALWLAMKLKPIVDSDDFADICRMSHASRTDNLLWRILGGGVTALYVLLFKNKQKNTKIICMSRCVVAGEVWVARRSSSSEVEYIFIGVCEAQHAN